MRLISLSSNQKSFKQVNFNPTGPSFILAKQNNPEQQDNSKTYNGVGKSLLAALINFCLGASAKNSITVSLNNKLPNWSFQLVFEHDGSPHTILRSANKTKEIFLNGKEMSLSDFCSEMAKFSFDIPDSIKSLSFRSLMPFFLRPSKYSYLSYNEPLKFGTPYQKQLSNAFLLGLNVNLAQNKMILKKEFSETQALQSNVKNDPILKEFFLGYRDSSLALIDLNDRIKSLNIDLKNFEVADDYYQIKSEADEIKKQIDATQNQMVLKENSIENIQKSLHITPDVSREDILKIYDESKLIFRNEISTQLDQLEDFYKTLTKNRTKRLNQQKQLITSEASQLNDQFVALKKNFSEKLKYLDAHRALDVFTKMSNQLSDYQQQRDKLQGFEKLQKDYESKISSINTKLAVQTQETSKYIENEKSVIDGFLNFFRELAKEFYPNALAGITVHNNTGKNQTRFDIEAKIESDTSDGINSVKLFCYDLTLLMHGFSHRMEFVFHDSRLFSDIDEVHCNMLFKIVLEYFHKESGYQYIATINQNQLNALTFEYQSYVRNNTVLELTDESDESKLLGITVELEYDKL